MHLRAPIFNFLAHYLNFKADKEWQAFPQLTVMDNYQLLCDTFAFAGIELIPLMKSNGKGICMGLCCAYILYAKENRRDEFFACLRFVASLNQEMIDQLLKYYKDTKAENKSFSIQDQDDTSIHFNKLLQFFTCISITQQTQLYTMININWDNTISFFCHANQLGYYLYKANISAGEYLVVHLGGHVFTIERIPAGFYVFEPNLIKKPILLKTVQALADTIINNLIDTNLLTPTQEITFAIRFLSYSDKNRQLDDLIAVFAPHLELRYQNIAAVITEYQAGLISRIELALTLVALIHLLQQQDSFNDFALNNFVAGLKAYLESQKDINKQEIITQELLTKPESVKNTAYVFANSWLSLAVDANQITTTKTLLKNHADPNLACRGSLFPPLMMAIERNYSVIVPTLLEAGADANFVNPEFGCTPLLRAIRHANIALVKALLLHNANPNIAEKDGSNPLCIAVQFGYEYIVKLLLAAHANIHIVMPLSVIELLQVAARHDRKNEVREVAAYKCGNRLSQQILKLSALQLAAFYGNSQTVAMLLQAGATDTNEDCILSASDLARAMNHMQIVRQLESFEVDAVKNYKNSAHVIRFFNHVKSPSSHFSVDQTINKIDITS